jgi:acyl CoA:acetate/3-ketoacid CoA transferase alpha subunit
MHLFFRLTFLTLFLLSSVSQRAIAQDHSEPIRLTIPQNVITKVIRALLPIHIDTHSKSVDGDITIINISDLQLTQGHLACRLHLAGNNLALLTEIAGHDIRLKVGTIELDVTSDAALRFDPKKQTLYIKPVINDVAKNNTEANGEIGKALIAMLNGREYPVSMKNLDPLVAEAGAKTVTINTKIVNIEAKPKEIQLSLHPVISTK